MNIRLPLLLLPPLLATLAATASAAERYWDGGDATGNWTAATNWDGNTALNLATDDLNFPFGVPAADRTVNNNYPANTLFHNINFLDGGYTVNGTIMGLTDGVTGLFATGGVTINAGFTLQHNQTFAINGGGDMTFGASSQIYLNGFPLNMQAIHADSVLTVGGLLTGGGGNSSIGVSGAGKVYFSGAKTFTADLTIDESGELHVDNAGSLGGGAGTTTINKGKLVLDSAAPLSIPETIRMVNADPDQSCIITSWP